MPSRWCWSVAIVALTATWAAGQTGYRLPPKAVVDVIDAPSPPTVVVSTDGGCLLLVDAQPFPPISVIARPFAGLAGLRIDPARSCLRRVTLRTGITVEEVATHAPRRVALPAGTEMELPSWSPDSRSFAFTRDTEQGMRVWIGDRATATARPVDGLQVTDVLGPPMRWLDDHTLLVRRVPPARGPMPVPPTVPAGPVVEQNDHRRTRALTYPDLLTDAYDESLFDHFATTQLARLDTRTGAVTPVGRPGVIMSALPSPDGKYLVVTQLKRPYSYRMRFDAFSRTTEVWDGTTGASLRTLVDRRTADALTGDDVAPPGGRGFQWDPTEPASLYWFEALRAGDRMVALDAPFEATDHPYDVARFAQRVESLTFAPRGHQAILAELDRNRHWRTTYLLGLSKGATTRQALFSLSTNDVYHDPGRPLSTQSAAGQGELLETGDDIYLYSEGSSPDGDRPWVDRLNLRTRQRSRLFWSPTDGYDQFVFFVGSPDRATILTSWQTPTTPANYFLKRLGTPGSSVVATTRPTTAPSSAPTSTPAVDPPGTPTVLAELTHNADPNPLVTGAQRQLLTYRRPDGVELSATLYLPPGYDRASRRRLPVVMSAYPREYTDAAAAGQVHAAPNKFTRLWGTSPLMFLTHGYAVLMDAAMPVVGPPRRMNDTFVDQIDADAKAAVDTVVQMGVADRKRIVVFGYSYGAFMVGNLLEHTDLFAAGIACSGAYNRTLTPFGFQDEDRTYWEATDTYFRMSPFNFANHMRAPILLLHGQMDNNMGTFPIQSQRFYEAIAANGGTARLVLLPHEAHWYQARESVLDAVAEMFDWADRYTAELPTTRPATTRAGTTVPADGGR